MILHYAAGSAHSAAVRIALAEKGLVAEERRVDLARFAQHSPDFLALGSGGTVPVLEYGGRAIAGSFAVMLFLDEAFPQTPLAGADRQIRKRVCEWGTFVEERIAPQLAIVRWQALKGKVPDKAREGFERLPPARRALWQQADAGFAADRLVQSAQELLAAGKHLASALEQSDWLAGDQFTYADIGVYPHLAQFAVLGLSVPERVEEWLGRMAGRPSVAAISADLFLQATMGPEVKDPG